jgi:hypothetical protein
MVHNKIAQGIRTSTPERQTTGMHDPGAILADYPELNALFELWETKRGDNVMPFWRDFRADELDRWDPQLNVIAVRTRDGELDFVYKRFAGVIAELIARDMTGESLGQGLQGVREQLYHEHREVVDGRAPLVRFHDMTQLSLLPRQVRLLLPVTEDGETVSIILVCLRMLERGNLTAIGAPVRLAC